MIRIGTLRPASGATKTSKRRGKGAASGLGGTAGRGHKGHKARAGGKIPSWFEGGQMPIQRRLPKRGFKSLTLRFNAEVRLSDLERLTTTEVDVLTLKQAGLVPEQVRAVKVIAAGKLTKKIALSGVAATAGAKAAIEAVGGTVA